MEIADPDRCPRYIGAQIEGVTVDPPLRHAEPHRRVGMRPINALVDISNYVMLATGQPTHMFDADHIADHITVRRAAEGEKLSLLNGKQLTLTPDDLVIADAAGAVALAGVMGGDKDSVLPDTSRVIPEVANFESTGVRTALRYDNRTEASSRYEKAIDPERCDMALALTMQLLAEQFRRCAWSLSPTGISASRSANSWMYRCRGWSAGWASASRTARLPPSWSCWALRSALRGYHAPDGACRRATGDVSIKADIMEEVARMYGYENFEPTPIVTAFTGAINQLDKDLLRRIKEYPAFRCNMQKYSPIRGWIRRS